MQLTGQNIGGIARPAFLLARKCNWLANSQARLFTYARPCVGKEPGLRGCWLATGLARTCIMNMRNATCISKVPTWVTFLFIFYSVVECIPVVHILNQPRSQAFPSWAKTLGTRLIVILGNIIDSMIQRWNSYTFRVRRFSRRSMLIFRCYSEVGIPEFCPRAHTTSDIDMCNPFNMAAVFWVCPSYSPWSPKSQVQWCYMYLYVCMGILKACLNECNMLGSFKHHVAWCWMMLDQIRYHPNFLSDIVQHLAKNKKTVIVSSEICIKTIEMANSVDECAESFSQEPIVL